MDMTTAEVIAYSSIAISLAGVVLGYLKLRTLTPLEESAKVVTSINGQSLIIKDLEVAIERYKNDLIDLRAQMVLLRAELVARNKEFEAAKLQWADRELARKP